MKPPSTILTAQTALADITRPDQALASVLSRLMAPLARLCLAKGVPFAAVEDILKQAFVQEAAALQPGAASHGTVSRISTATGISRREVTRLTRSDSPVRPTKPPLATEVFARWTTDPVFRDHDGAPRVLKRQGPAPSFDSLAQSITRDLHPRSMLDELVRLGLAQHDEDNDCVALVRDDFIPKGDSRQMFGLLGDNVGDHLDAAVDNVLGDRRHLEQAVFADELSAESVEKLRQLVTAHWQAFRDAMVPTITELIEADHVAGRMQDQRVRIGLYTFTESMPDSDAPATESSANPSRKSTSKEHTK
ncbi:DUF6502 family protein [Geobacter sp. SVR]|uniref:DUF6502 family protein n=1 Tax=Geobacter sp. SVR TaxID=2495594 RepID=UPI00143EF8B1|nr:DUF6502 family protein [Geobacter sp. SVR]BCS52019.1 hypothetical protein GSVR_03270 [Geobacter sp. SVR]GCF87167.1 hypothetical protein GSbR_37670 [Geobacter sp. SVR]